jgi:hypothetical protein
MCLPLVQGEGLGAKGYDGAGEELMAYSTNEDGQKCVHLSWFPCGCATRYQP